MSVNVNVCGVCVCVRARVCVCLRAHTHKQTRAHTRTNHSKSFSQTDWFAHTLEAPELKHATALTQPFLTGTLSSSTTALNKKNKKNKKSTHSTVSHRHIEFEYNRSKYHLKDVVIGKIYFLLVSSLSLSLPPLSLSS